jgi:hypothetical protein
VQWWKVVGAAAFVGVAATGVLVARAERRHNDYTPEEIRERLQARAVEALEGESPFAGDEAAILAGAIVAAESPGGEARTAEVPSGEAPPGGIEAEAGGPPSESAEPPADVRRRLVTQVNRVRTRLGLRPRPTPRRKARERA